jgi:hypothetical protein
MPHLRRNLWEAAFGAWKSSRDGRGINGPNSMPRWVGMREMECRIQKLSRGGLLDSNIAKAFKKGCGSHTGIQVMLTGTPLQANLRNVIKSKLYTYLCDCSYALRQVCNLLLKFSSDYIGGLFSNLQLPSQSRTHLCLLQSSLSALLLLSQTSWNHLDARCRLLGIVLTSFHALY